MTKDDVIGFIAKWYSVPLLLLIWQLCVSSGLVTSRLMPSLVLVWDALVAEMANGVLPFHASVTVARALVGFTLAAVIGVILEAGRVDHPATSAERDRQRARRRERSRILGTARGKADLASARRLDFA